MIHKLSSFLIIIILAIACSSSKEQVNTLKNISKPSNISSGNLSIDIPEGWRNIEDNYEKVFSIWLVNDKGNAAIGFIPIHYDSTFLALPQERKIEFIDKMVTTKFKVSTDSFETLEIKKDDVRKIKINKRILNNGAEQNIIVFGDNGKYFESVAYFNNSYNPTDEEINLLFETQLNIITKSKIK